MTDLRVLAVLVRFTRLAFTALLPIAFAAPLPGQTASPPPAVASSLTWRIALTYLDLDPDGDSAAAMEVTVITSPGWLRGAGWMAGIMASGRGEAYLYAGVHRPVRLALGLAARPSFALGIYGKGGGIELGSPLEFRSALGLEREIPWGLEASLFLYHLSNAGLGSRNPGLEALGLGVSLPFVP